MGPYFSVYHVSAFALFTCFVNVKKFSTNFLKLDVLFLIFSDRTYDKTFPLFLTFVLHGDT